MRKCPACGGHSSVLDSRDRVDRVKRRRRCDRCGTRWTTVEIQADLAARQRRCNGGGESRLENGSEVLRFFFDEKIKRNVSYTEISRRSGVTDVAMKKWKTKANPSVGNLDAALGALGYELTVRKRIAR